MSSPLDIAGFKARTQMPSADVDRLEVDFPGYIVRRCTVRYSWICARLAKRYAVPFATPVPEVILGWLVSLVEPDAYRKRGWNPGDEQTADIEQGAKDAREEIALAADSENGLFDLPLREDTSESGISKGGPLGYSETSPYDWIDVEAEALFGR